MTDIVNGRSPNVRDMYSMSRIYYRGWVEERVKEIKGNDADCKTKVSKVQREHKVELTSFT